MSHQPSIEFIKQMKEDIASRCESDLIICSVNDLFAKFYLLKSYSVKVLSKGVKIMAFFDSKDPHAHLAKQNLSLRGFVDSKPEELVIKAGIKNRFKSFLGPRYWWNNVKVVQVGRYMGPANRVPPNSPQYVTGYAGNGKFYSDEIAIWLGTGENSATLSTFASQHVFVAVCVSKQNSPIPHLHMRTAVVKH
jgi:hypothetical protein